ncbi:cytidine deaminase [Arthrobacter sp. ov407]|uniref:ASCH domain-containing protein n=1 Tax=Arthrobacter sp. ov407 TaxID=1761748 RepID=UPI00088AB114|nr:ASCH domain-containing protein [Arthrobacter sp. ov407]SDL98745.1 cytidine deaminase [Arthrobacter sp. ov407]
MDLFESELRVIEAAEELAATLGADDNHTVAAAAMDTSGVIHRAVNVYHFTGGPCAEFVVMGVAATAGAGPLVTMAAAGDGGRGLIPPCGRCRQAMLDLHPDVMVAVPGEWKPQLRPIRKLLPDTFFHPEANARRMLRFNKSYYGDVASGVKTTTIRYDDPVAVGPALFMFEDDEEHRTLEGAVTAVEHYRLDQLTPEQARLAPEASLAGLRQGLQRHYPDMPAEAHVSVVTFVLES